VKRLVFTAALITGLVAAGLAQGAISLYKTSFSSRAEYKSVASLERSGGACDRSWRNKDALGVTVRGGKADCSLITPVEGDSKQPDHIVQVVAKVTKATDDKVKESVYVGVTVRANRKEGYELRVFPKARTWQLIKNGAVLDENRDKGIEGLAKKNRLQLAASGSTVTAKVNGKRLTEFRDKDAEQVGGRKTGLTYGNRKEAKKALGEAFFDKLKVQVPVP